MSLLFFTVLLLSFTNDVLPSPSIAVDFLITTTTLSDNNEEQTINIAFALKHNEVTNWKQVVKSYSMQHGLNVTRLCDAVFAMLNQYAYPYDQVGSSSCVDEFDQPPLVSSGIRASEIIQSRLQNAAVFHADHSVSAKEIFMDDKDKPIYFIGHKKAFRKSNAHIDSTWLMSKRKGGSGAQTVAASIPSSIRALQKFIVYQTRFVRTGGTTALFMLHKELVELGYSTVLCGEDNHATLECSQPTGRSVCSSFYSKI